MTTSVKAPNIVLRLSVYNTESKDLDEAAARLPFTQDKEILGEPVRLLHGTHPTLKYKSSCLNYSFEYTSVWGANDCVTDWIQKWQRETESLQALVDGHGYNVSLLAQITVFEGNFPELVFPKETILALAAMRIDLSFYFYHE